MFKDSAQTAKSGIGSPGDAAQLFVDNRLNSQVYLDPEIFNAELEEIFYHGWVYVGHESEIRHPGDYKTTTIGKQPVILNRGADDGQVQVMFNRCRHRAARVCQEPVGNANAFRCPYHGWMYKSNGDLVGVPFRQAYGKDFPQATLGLVHVAQVANYRGFIFANLSEDGPGIEDYLGNARPFLDMVIDQGNGLEVRGGVSSMPFHANWKLGQENIVDNYHTSVVHKVFISILGARTGGEQGWSGNPEHRTRDLGNGHSCLDFRGTNELNVFGAVPFNLAIFPNLSFVGAQIRVLQPIAVDQTMVQLQMTQTVGATTEEDAARLRHHEEFFGPAGFGMPDDFEVIGEYVWPGLQADRGSPWLDLTRGVGREEVDETGVVSGHITDELTQRAFYKAWAARLANRSEVR